MNCQKHPETAAVANCVNCGVGVCAKCASETESLKQEIGILCIPCYKIALSEMEKYRKKEKKILIANFVGYAFCIAFFIFAMICAIYLYAQPNTVSAVIWTILAFIPFGFLYAIRFARSLSSSYAEYYERNPDYKVIGNGIYKNNHTFIRILFVIIYFIIGSVIGLFLYPYNVYKNVKNWKTNKIVSAWVEEEQFRVKDL